MDVSQNKAERPWPFGWRAATRKGQPVWQDDKEVETGGARLGPESGRTPASCLFGASWAATYLGGAPAARLVAVAMALNRKTERP